MSNQNFEEVIKLLGEGFSLIPVRDQDEEVNGEVRLAKTPYFGWKRHMSTKIEGPELWTTMEKEDTSAVAIVCGKISGNLEVIDIDSKYKPGIDAILFADISKLFPELFGRLRIHRTPSGGYHILYKVADGEAPADIPNGFPGNKKLAGYLNDAGKPVNFLETRGEGGYVLAPPSMGYAVHQDVPVPVLSWSERCSLIVLCESYKEIVKVVKMPKAASAKSENYSESPYEHFTASDAAAHVLINNGWKMEGENSTRIYYTRPGKDSGISASFHKEQRYYYFFTSSTDFDPQKGYFPGHVLAMLEHGGDHKATFKRLISEGYGKIKPSVEKKLAINAAKKGYELPPNISPEAKQQYRQVKEQLAEAHPYGVFWEYNQRGEVHINRQKLHEVAVALGFRLYLGGAVRIEGYKVLLQEEADVYNALKEYIREEDAEDSYCIHDVYESFLQKSGKFTIQRFPRLDESLMKASTFSTSYKFYLNGYLEITRDSYQLHSYEALGDELIWEASILQRDFVARDDYHQSLYYHFLNNAIGLSEHLMQVIGFYAHDYKDETTGYICVMVEQVANPEDGGGVGKNVFAGLLRETTTMRSVPGSQVDWSDKLLSTWNMEKIFSISDAPQKTDYAFLKELSTGEGSFRRLFRDPVIVPCRSMPKFLISTNFSYELSDGGLKRRIIPVEFTDFYTKNGGVDVVHGGHFPKDWDEVEYQWFDNVIIKAIQAYLKANCKLSATPLTETGWEKQFKQTHGEMTWNFIAENWREWLEKTNILPEEFNKTYEAFCDENNVSVRYRKHKVSLNKALSEFARHHKITYNPAKVVRLPGMPPVKHQVFE